MTIWLDRQLHIYWQIFRKKNYCKKTTNLGNLRNFSHSPRRVKDLCENQFGKLAKNNYIIFASIQKNCNSRKFANNLPEVNQQIFSRVCEIWTLPGVLHNQPQTKSVLLGGIRFVLKPSEEFFRRPPSQLQSTYPLHSTYLPNNPHHTYLGLPSKSPQFQWMNSIKSKRADTKSLAIHT